MFPSSKKYIHTNQSFLIPHLFKLGEKLRDSDFLHYFEEGTKLKVVPTKIKQLLGKGAFINYVDKRRYLVLEMSSVCRFFLITVKEFLHKC